MTLTSTQLDEAEMRDAMMFHAARGTIDRGFIWFVMETSDVDESIATTTSTSTSLDPIPPPPPTTTQPVGDQGASTVSWSRESNATVTVRMFRERPDASSAREARVVLDEVAARRE